MTQQLTKKQKIEFHPLYPFGMAATGLDVKTLTQPESDILRLKLADNGVIVIRNQLIDDCEFVTFLQQLGPLDFTTGEKPVEHQPMLNVVTNVGRTQPPRSVFHTDTSYVLRPPAYTALRAIRLPQSGGETLFCDQYRAFDTLPRWAQRRLSKVKVLHAVSGLTLAEEEEQQTWQPLLRRHPVSGRISLFMSTPERCLAVSGLSKKEAQRVIRLLYKHSIRPARLYRHRWQLGDIVVWDNRCTMHRADHSQVVGDRILHRGLISGEIPIGL